MPKRLGRGPGPGPVADTGRGSGRMRLAVASPAPQKVMRDRTQHPNRPRGWGPPGRAARAGRAAATPSLRLRAGPRDRAGPRQSPCLRDEGTRLAKGFVPLPVKQQRLLQQDWSATRALGFPRSSYYAVT